MPDVLEELFGNDAQAFVNDYWTRIEHHFVATHGRGRVRDLASLPVFGALERVVAAHAGRGIVAQRRLGRGPVESHSIEPSQIDQFLSQRYTIVFERFHDSVPELGGICVDLARALGFDRELTCCNLFLTAPGGGIFKHFDDKDVWVVGIRGVKQFAVAPNRELVYPTANSTEPSDDWREYNPVAFADDMPSDATIVDVKPGVTLFMPPGYWHATTSGEGAWSLSFAMRRPSWREVIIGYISRELVRDPRWRALIPSMTADTHMEEAIRARFADLIGRLQTWQPIAVLSPTSIDPLRNRKFAINRAATVSSDAKTSTICVEDLENITTLSCDDSVRALVQLIQDVRDPIAFDELCARSKWSEHELLLVLHGLIHAGVLEAP